MPKNQDTPTAETTEGEQPTAPEKPAKAPLSEGHVTPVQFAHILAKPAPEGRGVTVAPQVVYGYVRNNKQFPSSQTATGQWQVDLQKGLEWWDAKETRKAERAAAAAAKAAASQTSNGNAEQSAEAAAANAG